MIAIDLCKVNYQKLLIACLELMIKNADHVGKEKIKSECYFMGFKNHRLNYKCKECGERCSKLINEAIRSFLITYQFYNVDFNKFVLLLRKVVYSYEYMDSWERFMKHQHQIKQLFTAN